MRLRGAARGGLPYRGRGERLSTPQVFSWYCGGVDADGWLVHCDLLSPRVRAGSRLLGAPATRRFRACAGSRGHPPVLSLRLKDQCKVLQVTSTGEDREVMPCAGLSQADSVDILRDCHVCVCHKV